MKFDEIFGRLDTLQFFSRESKDYKCLRNIFGVSGTLRNCSRTSSSSRRPEDVKMLRVTWRCLKNEAVLRIFVGLQHIFENLAQIIFLF